MKKIVIIVALISMVLISCSSKENDQIIKVDVSANNLTTIEEKADISSIITLQYNEPIGKIRKLIHHNSNYYMLDDTGGKIYSFNKDGKLIYIISNKGNGANEYAGIQNFFINNKNNTINIISINNFLYQYNLEHGTYIRSEAINTNSLMILDAITLDNGEIAYCEMGPEYNLKIGEKEYIPFLETRDFAFMEKAFSKDDKGVLFVHGMDDNIYEILKDTVIVRYTVDFGKESIAPEKYSNPDEVNKIFESRNVAGKIDELTNTKDYLAFSYFLFSSEKGVNKQYAIYNKSNKTALNSPTKSILMPIRGYKDANTFISLVSPYEVIDSNENWQGITKIKEFIKSNNIGEDSNQFIVLWKL